jgi:hypothetical protein
MTTPRQLVIPAKAGIQYSRAAEIEPRRRGVLDRPVKPGDDSEGFDLHLRKQRMPAVMGPHFRGDDS